MTLAYIPSPSISQFSIGPVTIHFYAITMLLAIAAAIWMSSVRWKRLGGTTDQIFDIALCAVPAGIIGARLYHVITTPERFFGSTGNWVDIFKIWQGGLGIWGAVLLGALAAWAWCRHRHYPAALLCDTIAPALLVAQAIGRLGNWFNQELYGAPTTLPWGLKLNTSGTSIGSTEQCYDGSSCPTGTLFQPTFLYEMIWNLIGAALLIWIGRKAVRSLKAGALFTLYIIWYTAGRTWIESLRIDFAHEFLGVRVNVWVSMAVFVLGVMAFVVVMNRGKSTALLAEKLRTITEIEERQLQESEHSTDVQSDNSLEPASQPSSADDSDTDIDTLDETTTQHTSSPDEK
ncbi:MAG: prolipoprotein diacylglyceryl transferase [Bifidobacterium sp.]|jgi:prolipoprotein diacylglyceryl transferase|nr:prolipoprotein diacylglyceryl transferase [Bifidobacterium sp.]MCH4174298.1 prolipoprotein diacylglyceryl transferase [Bifidobacterium sp.]